MPTYSRIILFAEDLRAFSAGSDKSNYRLYKCIHTKYGLDKNARVTIYHVRDYFKISIEDVMHSVFGEKHKHER
ncbi:MAG: hypothetical protein EOP00_22350 [Pedobacter sp.]|nr:MAG: hypothetical protein EOP00_22350 [Pedobacter sp.]